MDVKSVDVLAQLAVGGVEGVREADAAEGRRVVGEAGTSGRWWSAWVLDFFFPALPKSRGGSIP